MNRSVIVTLWICDAACFGHQLETNGLFEQNFERNHGKFGWICVRCDFYGRFLSSCTGANSGRRVGLFSRQVWPTRVYRTPSVIHTLCRIKNAAVFVYWSKKTTCRELIFFCNFNTKIRVRFRKQRLKISAKLLSVDRTYCII